MPARPAASDPPVCPVSGDRRPCTIIATPPGSREPNEVYPTSLPRTTNQASATLGPQPQTVVDISAPLPSVARCVPARRRCGRRSRCIAGIRVGDGRFCPSDRGRRATQSTRTKQNCAPQQIRLACCICERQSVSRRRASAHCFLGRFLPKLRRCQKHRRFFVGAKRPAVFFRAVAAIPTQPAEPGQLLAPSADLPLSAGSTNSCP